MVIFGKMLSIILFNIYILFLFFIFFKWSIISRVHSRDDRTLSRVFSRRKLFIPLAYFFRLSPVFSGRTIQEQYKFQMTISTSFK